MACSEMEADVLEKIAFGFTPWKAHSKEVKLSAHEIAAYLL